MATIENMITVYDKDSDKDNYTGKYSSLEATVNFSNSFDDSVFITLKEKENKISIELEKSDIYNLQKWLKSSLVLLE